MIVIAAALVDVAVSTPEPLEPDIVVEVDSGILPYVDCDTIVEGELDTTTVDCDPVTEVDCGTVAEVVLPLGVAVAPLYKVGPGIG